MKHNKRYDGMSLVQNRNGVHLLIVSANTSARVSQIVDGLANKGYDITLVNTSRSIIPTKVIKNFGVKSISGSSTVKEVIVGGKGALFSRLPLLLRFLFSWPLVFISILRQTQKTTLVIGVTPDLSSGLPALICSKLFSKPFLLDYPDLMYYGDSVRPQCYLAALEKFQVKSADAISVVTNAWKEFILNEWKVQTRHIAVVSAAVEKGAIDSMKREDHRASLRMRLQLRETDFILGYAGGQWYRKLPNRGMVDIQGVDSMIASLVPLFQRYPNLHIVLAGATNISNIGHQVHNLGPFTTGDSNHLDVLLGVDLLLLPSERCVTYQFFDRFKGFEYLASGTPVLAADMPPIRETLGDRVQYYHVDDTQALQNGVVKFMERSLATSVRYESLLTDNDTWDARVGVFESLISELLGETDKFAIGL